MSRVTVPRGPRALAAVSAVVLLAMLAGAPRALAHAQLLDTVPAAGSTVATPPPEVIFEFDQNVGGTLGAVRVYDAQGHEVDNLDVTHPRGNSHWMGVALKSGLSDGTYTATYRVISADTHVVYGGLVFNIGRAGAPPRVTVAGLVGRNEAGRVTKIAFGIVRGADYLTLALFIGGLAFAWLSWGPALALAAGQEPRWSAAARGCAGRIRVLLGAAVIAGVIVSALGVLLQGATAAGVSLWSSLKSSVLESTLESRFGEVWTGRAADWLLIGLVLLAARAAGADPVTGLEPASDLVEPRAVRRPPAGLVLLLGLGAAYLAITPALAGHASVQGPRGVFFPSDVLHVLAASIWVGGIACLLLVLPAATRQLEGHERSELLLATLTRFSPLALGSVIVIAVTGVVQAYIDVRSIDGLTQTTYGALIIAKVVLLLALIGLGWVNRERVIPGLRRIVAATGPTGGIGLLARSTMRRELALMLAVFGVTAALVSYAPPIDAASGPFSANTTIGPAELEMTVDPARVGPNTVHLYLIDAKTGAQFTATKELTATARLPAKHIGPLPLKVSVAGPGHYILSSAVLSPGGTWEITILDRVSEFEANTRVVKVPIR